MVAPMFIAGTAIKFVGAGIAARLSQSPPHLVGADALMPSEEGCSIPFPPGRRKLHIRSLLLPSQIVTVSLGHNLAIWNFTTPHAILMMAGRRLLSDTVKTETFLRRKSRARLWSIERVRGNHPKGFPGLFFLLPGVFFLEKQKENAVRFPFFPKKEEERV